MEWKLLIASSVAAVQIPPPSIRFIIASIQFHSFILSYFAIVETRTRTPESVEVRRDSEKKEETNLHKNIQPLDD